MSSSRWAFPYPSRRMPVMARNVVAASQPLAASAGLRMLLEGGNAVDAALAAAIALTVVEPTSNGIGGDAFALVWDGRGPHGLNASGRSPLAWTPERFAGRERMPEVGWDSVTVPGAVSAWVALSDRFGRLPFERLFAPAIAYARDGFALSPITAEAWGRAPQRFGAFAPFMQTFCPGGRAPVAGEIVRLPDHGATLEKIAASRGEAFYRGELAERIAAHAAEAGGAMTMEDLARHAPEWVEPIGRGFAGVRLHEIPPNGQGIAALIALGILEELSIGGHALDSADCVHLQIEAMKIAFAETSRHVGDPACMAVGPRALLDDGFLAGRAAEVRLDRATPFVSAIPAERGTVNLAAADASGMMVSFIQSNFWGFGSGVVVPGTGIAMQNRGLGFTLEPGHPNQVGGGKRPYHTIIPGFVTREGEPVMAFGVMGGHMQPQGHAQMMVRIFAHGQNPQAASDAPRWQVAPDLKIWLEEGFSPGVAAELRRRGHEVVEGVAPTHFGGAQLVERTDGGYLGASDHRKDGHAIGY